MNINEFIAERKGDWERLDRMSRRVGPGTGSRLTRDDIWELGGLYSAAVSDLSILKSSPLGLDSRNDIIAYLNGLVIRVHGIIYRKPGFRPSAMKAFLLDDVPEAFREAIGYIGVSAAIFAVFGVVGALLAFYERGFIELLVPENIIASVESGKTWFEGLYTAAPAASSMLMTHNIAVTFLLFGAGITMGIGTVYLLALNGLLIGTIAVLCMRHDLSLQFWSFVIPHASLEVTAILIAGGAGLVLGHALIDPGPYRRTEYLAVRARVAGKLIVGCVPLLVLAGIIEAFFSPSPVNEWVKIAVGVLLFASLLTILAMSGLRQRGRNAQ